VFVFNTRLGKHIGTVVTESAPVCLEYVAGAGGDRDKDLLVASCADMTLSTYSMSDPNHNRRYRQRSAWSTPGVQMALAYMPANNLLYSGGTNGNLYSWKIAERSLISTFSGHTDIVMALTVLQKLNNVASGSLDKTVNVWDSYTNSRVLELHGHKKGVLDMTYNSEYRLLFSCGFEHDACVWSPFVNSLVYRFRGHHASLVGIQAVEGTPEVLTADISGIFKLWDIRNYNCVQTFMTNLTGSDTKDSSRLSCFFQTRMPPVNSQQKEDDSRIYAASKMLFSFDQARVVHDATTDFTIVMWVGWNADTSTFITVSANTVICWNALIGSKTVTNSNISAEEISACCLDDRKRKILLGDVKGNIGVFNCTNGAKMKGVQDNIHYAVIALQYVNAERRFIAGYANGLMRIYDENSLEDCNIVKTFDSFNRHQELLCLVYNEGDNTVATVGASSGVARLWDNVVGKCEMELRACDSTECVVTVTYLGPFPLLAISDSRGNVCIWGSRGCKWAGKRVCGFMNQTPADAKHEKLQRPNNSDDEEKPRRVLSFADWETGQIGASSLLMDDMAGDEFDEIGGDDNISVGSSETSSSYSEEDEGAFSPTEPEPDVLAALDCFRQSEETWGRAMAASCIAFDPQSYRLYTADDLGCVRCYSLRYMMHDIGGRAFAKNHASLSSYRLKDQCAHRSRDDPLTRAAPPPIYRRKKRFLVGRLNDAMSFLGAEFCWALSAHDNRIVFATCTTDGLLTSGTDRLVKMWSFDGLPLGVLLQSVPVGLRSQTWDLELDAEALVERDERILDSVIEGVVELTKRDDIPDINLMDMEGIEPGVTAADFSRSELRQRIELTSDILGIDFPTESEQYRRKMRTLEQQKDDLDSLASTATTNGKSLDNALKELKSSDAAVDYSTKIRGLSLMQKRHRAVKMEMVSGLYAEKSGVNVPMDVELYPESGMRAKESIKSSNLPKALCKVEDHMLGVAPAAEGSSNKQSAMFSSKSMDSKTLQRRRSAKRVDSAKDAAAEPDTIFVPRYSAVNPGKLAASGPRAQSINSRCSQYASFTALDKAMENIGKSSARLPPLQQRPKTAGSTFSVAGAATLSSQDPGNEEVMTNELTSQRRETTRIHEFHQMLIQQIANGQPNSGPRPSTVSGRTRRPTTGSASEDSPHYAGHNSEPQSRRNTAKSMLSSKTRTSSGELERSNSGLKDIDAASTGSRDQ
jgi:WD40 repeat protein